MIVGISTLECRLPGGQLTAASPETGERLALNKYLVNEGKDLVCDSPAQSDDCPASMAQWLNVSP